MIRLSAFAKPLCCNRIKRHASIWSRGWPKRALELMRSYAASRSAIYWKLRLPASLPYLFTALKITATASIVGAIVGEGPGGIRYGLGRAILFFSQQYTIAPEKLWSAILVTAALGVIFFGIVRVAELFALRRWPEGFAA